MTATASRRAAALFAAALVALFAFTALFRFLLLTAGFTNDHFLYIAGAQQIRFGDWPTRDFLDPGLPLMYVASVAAQALVGPPLLAEALLVAAAFATAAVLTALAVRDLTGSRLLGVIAALLEIAIVPRTYGYPKVLVYALAFYLVQRYISRPTTGRLFALAVTVVVAFLFRHDHGAYVGVVAAAAAWLAPVGTPSESRIRRVALLVGMVVLVVAPYVLYVQAYAGVWTYLQRGLDFRSSEFRRQWHVWPALVGSQWHEAALLYEYWAIPAAAALVLLASWRSIARTTWGRVVPLVAAAVLVNFTFLREPLGVRLQDAVVPAVTLGAWLFACAWRSPRRWLWRPVAVILAIVVSTSMVDIGGTHEQLGRAGLLVTWVRIPEFVTDVTEELRAQHNVRQLPNRADVSLLPFYDYVDRCTTPQQRLLVLGFLPEIFVFAHRAFAGGIPAFVGGYYDSDAYQAWVIRKLQRESVPFALVPGEAYASPLDTSFPRIARYVSTRYEPLVTFGTDPPTQIQVLFDRTLRVSSRDAQTGWPCLK